jgi:hypothetical protein
MKPQDFDLMKHMSESSEGPGIATLGKTGGENQFRWETEFGSFDFNVLKHLNHPRTWKHTLETMVLNTWSSKDMKTHTRNNGIKHLIIQGHE